VGVGFVKCGYVCGICNVCVCVCGGGEFVMRGCVYVWVCMFLLTFSMLHYKVILHAFMLNFHNTVTYIYTYVQFLPFSTVTAGLLSVF